jgi:competence protein ComEC
MKKTLFIILSLILFKTSMFAAGVLTVTFLDVGQGSSIVVQSPIGKIMVVDCGTSNWKHNEMVGDKVTAPYISSLGKNRIDVAILTHPHSDHVSGFARLLKKKPANYVLDLGISEKLKEYRDFIKEVKKSKANYKKAKRGQSIDLGGGVKVYVLSPNPYIKYRNLNDNSIVLWMIYKNTAFMLPGDAGVDVEYDISTTNKGIWAQVIQVGHHGSKNSTSDNWLDILKPSAGVISVGRRNIYHLPARSTTKKLEKKHIKIYRTDKNGAIIFKSDGHNIRVITVLK